MAALDWLQSLLGGGQYGDPSTPAMSPQPLPDDALTRLRDTLGQGAASSLYAGGGDVQPGLNMLGRAVVAPALAGGAALEATMTGQPVSAAEMLQAAMMGITPTPTRLPGGVPSATPTAMERLWADEFGGIRAFHGSPHNFDRFDLSKIGTGEGAQAYGHGLYFAENEGVARGYRDALAPSNTKWMYGDNVLSGAEQNAAEILDRRGSVDSALGWLKVVRQGRGADQKYLDATEEAIRRMDPAQVSVVQSPGHMYEVDINADPKSFLDWDRPLAGQQTVETLTRLGIKEPPSVVSKGQTFGGWGSRTGGDIYDRLARDAAAQQGQLGFDYPGASAALREAGIPGIRYLDQGSRGAGQGSSNYAIFDPKIIEILRKYGILPPVAAGGGLLATGSEPPI